ncbi:MAG: hypothetical protein LWW77_05750 [Propionibacteriales bacterium]|nr:hypothetical protein [Propionibacteriales bacterium]
MSYTGHDSQLGLVRGPIAAAAAVALTALITAFLPPSTVLAEPPMPAPATATYTAGGHDHPAPTQGR